MKKLPQNQDHPAFKLMLACSLEHHQPKRFPTDLTTHDRAYLQKQDPKKPFGWSLYNLGTYLCTHGVRLDTLIACEDTMRESGAIRHYVWDGAELREVVGASGVHEALAGAQARYVIALNNARRAYGAAASEG